MSLRDLFEGLLLSDGNLHRPGACHFPRYQQSCKEAEFLEWVASLLPVPSKIYGPYEKFIGGRGPYFYYVLKTNTDEWFDEYLKRWYRDGKKIIPDDFVTNADSMLTTYMGDGCLNHRSTISLALNSFDRDSIDSRIISCLAASGMDHWYYEKNRNVVYSNTETAHKFLDLVGSCPVSSLKYKWDIKPIMSVRRVQSLNERNFSFISPSGQVVVTDNLKKFCREQNLERKYMSRVHWGDQLHHKGWKKW